ncbi:MAG TPA: hypothetical protein VMH39_17385 [Gemmatimonadaceae bacterium]|nr:hypothetical protein [Gemmatimonadaceae bacterium]
MIMLRDKETGQTLGTIPDEQLQFLMGELEEESPTDVDYWLQPETIDMLEDDGAPADLITLLRAKLGGREGMEIQWSRA